MSHKYKPARNAYQQKDKLLLSRAISQWSRSVLGGSLTDLLTHLLIHSLIYTENFLPFSFPQYKARNLKLNGPTFLECVKVEYYKF
jgi:hypothetical protein